MFEQFPMADALRERMAKAAEAVGASETDFVRLAIAEKIARVEHDIWLRNAGEGCGFEEGNDH